MAKQRKLPAMQFYTGDWMKDTNLRGVSLAAKGLWIDMLCLMHESDRRGYLQSNGKPIAQEQLARMTGCSSDEASQCLEELENSGVFSRTKNSTIYSRRMKRDEEIRQKSIINGRLGGNPALKAGVNPPLNPKGGSSSSTSVSNSLSACVRVGEEGEPGGKTDVPPRLADCARDLGFGLTPEAALKALLMGYPEDWIEKAMTEAALQNNRSLHYVRGILKRYKEKGGSDGNRHQGDHRKSRKNDARKTGGKYAGRDEWASPGRADENRRFDNDPALAR